MVNFGKNVTFFLLSYIDLLLSLSKIIQSMTTKTDSVRFTTKGQVVIPSWLRKQFEIEELMVAASKKDSPLHMTDVNYAEVKYSIVKKDGAAAWEEAAKILQGLPIEFHPTDRALADSAADFKARFKMSLADAFAAALA